MKLGLPKKSWTGKSARWNGHHGFGIGTWDGMGHVRVVEVDVDVLVS